MSTEPAPPRPPSSARRMFARAVLVSEVLVVLFAALVAHGLRLADLAVVWGVAAGAALLLVLATALLRRPAGYVIGTAAQVLLVAAGVVVPMLAVVGAVFAVLWFVSFRVGGRIDAERVERYRAEVAHHGAERAEEADAGRGDRLAGR